MKLYSKILMYIFNILHSQDHNKQVLNKYEHVLNKYEHLPFMLENHLSVSSLEHDVDVIYSIEYSRYEWQTHV
jgi:hypothetical protein